MTINYPQSIACAAALVLAFPMQNTFAASAPCNNSASLMERSCFFESREEYNAVKAQCLSIAPTEDRIECQQDAKDERNDALEECSDQLEARLDACELLGENRYQDPLEDESINFIDPDDIGVSEENNPYVILQAGHTHVLEADDEIIIVHATDEVREIQDVLCRVVVDIAVEEEYDEEDMETDYEAIEVTDDWFAQDDETNVYYCGEVAQNFEDGVLRDLDGSFESGYELAKGGVLTLAMPAEGDVHRTEYALGEAEDIVEYLELATGPTEDEGGDNESFPCGEDGCLKTFDFSPLEPESTEYKYYLPDVGFVLAVSLEDGEIEEDGREELVCIGDSLAILADDPDCGIENPEELLEELCELHDELCMDDDDD